MSLDTDKIWKDVQAAAQPELKKLRATFLSNMDEFVDSSRVHVLDELMEKAANYELQAVGSQDPNIARQYAEAAEDVLRQISVVLVAEKAVAEKQVAAMIQAAALSVWEGFKSVATGLLGVAIKGVISGLVPGGGAIADAVGDFLEDGDGSDDTDQA